MNVLCVCRRRRRPPRQACARRGVAVCSAGSARRGGAFDSYASSLLRRPIIRTYYHTDVISIAGGVDGAGAAFGSYASSLLRRPPILMYYHTVRRLDRRCSAGSARATSTSPARRAARRQIMTGASATHDGYSLVVVVQKKRGHPYALEDTSGGPVPHDGYSLVVVQNQRGHPYATHHSVLSTDTLASGSSLLLLVAVVKALPVHLFSPAAQV